MREGAEQTAGNRFVGTEGGEACCMDATVRDESNVLGGQKKRDWSSHKLGEGRKKLWFQLCTCSMYKTCAVEKPGKMPIYAQLLMTSSHD